MTHLGTVDWIGTDKNDDPIASITPLFRVDPAGWTRVNADDFPSRGRVFWWGASNAAQSAPVFFEVQGPNRDQQDKFTATKVTPAYEVIDLRDMGDVDSIRRALTRGIKPVASSMSNRVYLRCEGDVVIGPVELILEDGLCRISGELHKIPMYDEGSVEFQELGHRSNRRTVLASRRRPPADAYLDWDPDQDVLTRALRFARRARKTLDDIALTDRVLREAGQQTTLGGNSAEQRHRRYQLDRARDILDSATITSELAETVVAELQKHPSIQAALEEHRQELAEKWRRQLEEQLKEQRSELERLKASSVVLSSSISSLKGDLAKRRAEHERALVELDAEMGERLEAIRQRPRAFLAETAILEAVLRPSPRPRQRLGSFQGPRIPKSASSQNLDAATTRDPGDLKNLLKAAFKGYGLKARTGRLLHGAIAGGLVPVLAGPGAAAAVQAYARVVAASRITWLRVDPNIMGLADLFGRDDRGVFAPHPSGLAELCAGTELSGPQLLVLEGVNRAPIEGYLLPLLRLARGVVPSARLFHPTLFDSACDYSSLAELRWPEGLFVAVTLATGPTVLPIPEELWTHCALVEARASERNGSVPDPTIAELRSACFRPREADVEALLETAAELGLAYLTPALRHLGAGCSIFEAKQDAITSLVEEAVVHPAVACADWISDEQVSSVLGNGDAVADAPLMQRIALLRRVLL